MTVYECIVAVSAEIAQTGIAKSRSNAQQGYKFRGIDDVYNALAPIIAKHKLVILPRVLSRTVAERATAKGGVLFSVTVDAEFDFVSATDGTKHTVRTIGEAMDSADKATNKAMSAAYKYAVFEAFHIPVVGEPDADNETHEVVAGTAKVSTTASKPKAQSRETYDRLVKAVRASGSMEELNKLWQHPATGEAFESMPDDWQAELQGEYADKVSELSGGMSEDPNAFPGDM